MCGCTAVSPFNGRVCLQTRALSSQRSRKSSTVGYSTVCEAFTETGPNHHEGNSGVSVKTAIQLVLRRNRVFEGNFGYFCFQEKNVSLICLSSKRSELAFNCTYL